MYVINVEFIVWTYYSWICMSEFIRRSFQLVIQPEFHFPDFLFFIILKNLSNQHRFFWELQVENLTPVQPVKGESHQCEGPQLLIFLTP